MTWVGRFSIAGFLLLSLSFAVAQEQGSAPSPSNSTSQVEAAHPAEHGSSANQASGVREQLAHASNEAAGHTEEEGEGHEEFKQSPAVKFIAKITGLDLHTAYWVLVSLNFLIIAVILVWALKKNLPGMFRARTETIRKSMDEARRASEDANRRLSDIESRLGRLDSEIEQMRKQAEADAAAEEARIRAAAEEERVKILAMSEQEIDAAAKAARRELKAYAADLAVSLAEKRISVDTKTDEALVRTFVRELGKDGR